MYRIQISKIIQVMYRFVGTYIRQSAFAVDGICDRALCESAVADMFETKRLVI